MSFANQIIKYYHVFIQHRSFPYFLLFFTSIAVGFLASDRLSTNSDAVIYPYLFRDFFPDQILFSEQHSNLLKFPLFFLQSLLPYNYFTYTLVNLFLFTATVLGWLYMSAKIAGKNNTLKVSVIMSAFLILSPNFADNLIYSTVRNIEFPIIFWILYEITQYLTHDRQVPSSKLVFAILVFCILIAGDFYYAFVVAAPIIFLLLLLSFFTKKRNLYFITAGLLMICIVLSRIVQKFLDIIGLYDTNFNYLSASAPITNLKELFFSINSISHQLLLLLNIDSYSAGGLSIGLLTSVAVLLGLSGFIAYILKHRRTLLSNSSKLLALFMVLTSVGSVAVYAVSGLSFAKDTTGGLIEIENLRYLMLVPLTLFFIIPYGTTLLRKETYQHTALITLCGLLLIIGTFHSIRQQTAQFKTTKRQQSAYRDLGLQIQNQGTTNILAGYWTATMLKFWSSDNFTYAIVADCNLPSIDNARRDWYNASSSVKSTALIISMQGSDLPFLGYCPAERLHDIYGVPSTETHFSRPKTNLSDVNIWYYPYDVRTKLQPIKTD